MSSAPATSWELVEFLSDRLFSTGAQKSLEDTMLDILFGVLGGAAFASVRVSLRSRYSEQARESP